jgi:4-hydroxybenzoate polyprenyltransferase
MNQPSRYVLFGQTVTVSLQNLLLLLHLYMMIDSTQFHKPTIQLPLRYHAYSIWLFTFSDLKTIVAPKTTFGILNALAVSLLLAPQAPVNRDIIRTILLRTPTVILWVWINLLPFAIDNQRQPAAILEDKHNKPWRTMPSGRMTSTQATRLMYCFYPTAACISYMIGGSRPCLALMALGYAYNDLYLADRNWITRNLINGLGFCCFASGALEVALGTPLTWEHRVILKWLGFIAAVVFSTVQTQDMADQTGDRLRGRQSMPLSVGDGPTRWITALLMVCWTGLAAIYWDLGSTTRMLIGILGFTVAWRTLKRRSIRADKVTFYIWNGWMALLYALPLLSALG